MRLITSLVVAFATLGLAHPGEDHTEELAQRRDFLAGVERSSLAHCAETLKARGVTDRNIKRRVASVQEARQQRGITKRDLNDVLNTDHNRTELGYTPNTGAETLFAGWNSCVLTPEVTIGPYYVSGESIRRSIAEDQQGVGLILDFQVIDVDTCEPVPELYLEIWHCNSTGVYGGVVAAGNGNSNDRSNLDNTWGRGIQRTDEDGVVQFETFFPGHYIGRATHIHLLAHANATLYANETLGNVIYSSHVGQTYFDQDLIDQVERLSPYTSNRQARTNNAQDMFLAQVANQDIDPVVEWTLLGDTVSEGLFAWYAYGINTTITNRVNPAVFRYEDGGHVNPRPPFGPPGGGQAREAPEANDAEA